MVSSSSPASVKWWWRSGGSGRGTGEGTRVLACGGLPGAEAHEKKGAGGRGNRERDRRKTTGWTCLQNQKRLGVLL